jgi:hypothetical protein
MFHKKMEKLSKCLAKQSKCKRGPRYYKNTEKTVPVGFIVPRASSCAFGNAISCFCLLALFLCLTNMILQFLYLTFWFLVLLCLTWIFWHLNSKFLLGSRIPSFYGHTVRFSSVCSCLSHYKNHISVPH